MQSGLNTGRFDSTVSDWDRPLLGKSLFSQSVSLIEIPDGGMVRVVLGKLWEWGKQKKKKREEGEKNASPKCWAAAAEGATLLASRAHRMRRLTIQEGHQVVCSYKRRLPAVLRLKFVIVFSLTKSARVNEKVIWRPRQGRLEWPYKRLRTRHWNFPKDFVG